MEQVEIKSAYIHIPFCKTICSYCDFCKMYYSKSMVKTYLDSLEMEIKSNYKQEKLNTLYIGGGTPSSLCIEELIRLFEILKLFNLNESYEYTIECNIENITEEKLKLFKSYGINRISVGVQTFNEKYLKFLNRFHNKENAIETIKLIQNYFDNINVDLIYAIPNETLIELENDIDILLDLDIKHISTYSLIIEDNTVLKNTGCKNIDDNLDYDMYNLIINKLSDYNHYEVSNFAKKGYESRHNLVYWDNNHYYGFGLGASGYIDNIRYTNTRSINNYNKGNYILEKEELSKEETISNEFILGLRKMDGIDKSIFKRKYNMNIKELEIVNRLLEENKLLENKKSIYINPNYIYTSNDILINFI